VNQEVDGRQYRQQLNSHDFSQTALELVAIDRGVAEARNDDTDAGMSERGSKSSDVEMTAPNSLPLSNDCLQVALPRQSKLAREAEAIVRRPRTCSGDVP
jgi:hypothetical protein